MDNPYLNRNKTKKHGQKAEKLTAKRFGTTSRPGSGAIEGFKGDMAVGGYLVENKSTEHRSISIKYAWLEKISKEALAENREAALAIQFVDATGRPISTGATWVLVPERVFLEIS